VTIIKERQRVRFSARVGRQSLWTPTGPTPLAEELLHADGGPLSHGEKVMLFIAWALWNGEGNVTLDEVLNTLDGRNLELVGGLLVALAGGSTALEGWLQENVARDN
jgi:ATPase subunit of ABC transporter with duplicated ATPase domains